MNRAVMSARTEETVPALTRLVAWGVGWVAIGYFLPQGLWHVLPGSLLALLDLPSYNMLCQALTIGIGVGATATLFENPRELLSWRRPAVGYAAVIALVAPALFVFSSWAALRIAEPYLLEELAREGAGASERNAGSFGRSVVHDPVFSVLLWGALFAAVGEELMFRGALFRAVERLARAVLGRANIAGLTAVVITAAAFGAMHADMPGSVGIVRVASASLLGLGCGAVRLVSGSVLASMLLHLSHNVISIGLGRHWFDGGADPLISVVPNRLLLLAVMGAAAAAVILGARRFRRSSPRAAKPAVP
jgi:membrane protease YdiL (CAAX protease family)